VPICPYDDLTWNALANIDRVATEAQAAMVLRERLSRHCGGTRSRDQPSYQIPFAVRTPQSRYRR
jgi:hypothetical protein